MWGQWFKVTGAFVGQVTIASLKSRQHFQVIADGASSLAVAKITTIRLISCYFYIKATQYCVFTLKRWFQDLFLQFIGEIGTPAIDTAPLADLSPDQIILVAFPAPPHKNAPVCSSAQLLFSSSLPVFLHLCRFEHTGTNELAPSHEYVSMNCKNDLETIILR